MSDQVLSRTYAVIVNSAEVGWTTTAVVMQTNQVSWTVGVSHTFHKWTTRHVGIANVTIFAFAFFSVSFRHANSMLSARMIICARIFACVVSASSVIRTIAVVETFFSWAFRCNSRNKVKENIQLSMIVKRARSANDE